MRLALKLGYVEGFIEPRIFQKRLGIKGMARAMAFERLEPFGFPIEDERHYHAAIFAKAEKPELFRHEQRKSGPMTAEQIAEKNRQAGLG